MYTTLLQLTNCQTVLRAAAAAKRTESQNHQSMYDCSFPTFSFYVVSEPSYCHVATRSSGTITFVFFFFWRINWKTLQKPSTSWSPPGRSQPLQMLTLFLFPIARRGDHKARLGCLVFFHMKGRKLCQVSPAHRATWTCESTVCWEAKLLK